MSSLFFIRRCGNEGLQGNRTKITRYAWGATTPAHFCEMERGENYIQMQSPCKS